MFPFSCTCWYINLILFVLLCFQCSFLRIVSHLCFICLFKSKTTLNCGGTNYQNNNMSPHKGSLLLISFFLWQFHILIADNNYWVNLEKFSFSAHFNILSHKFLFWIAIWFFVKISLFFPPLSDVCCPVRETSKFGYCHVSLQWWNF